MKILIKDVKIGAKYEGKEIITLLNKRAVKFFD
ncbi:hypothetical protein LCGC14_1100080 [marine sediment metagenome]|uniref:Uncharacterized protein n=1 Tax=marine sediment metagenome TaxID=412755 RepID=A0A0F9M9P3_9ZZZZ